MNDPGQKRKRGRPKVIDEFTDMAVSRQRKWQMRQVKRGRCQVCGEVASSNGFCTKHLVRQREYTRMRFGYQRENDCKSRQLEREEIRPEYEI